LGAATKDCREARLLIVSPHLNHPKFIYMKCYLPFAALPASTSSKAFVGVIGFYLPRGLILSTLFDVQTENEIVSDYIVGTPTYK
jgi:hypothetical protein